MPGLLFPAYQKFYSAISCLERFDKEHNFFDNISSLDSFFAEYRNITFAIQKALKDTEYFPLYESNRDKYLTDHWFVEKRNETTKQQPFQLIKRIDVTIYLPGNSISLYTQSFTVEDDVPMESLNSALKGLLLKVSCDEVFFSAVFSFFEKGTTLDLWDKLISGVASMNEFMDAMYKAVGMECPLCNQLREKIKTSKFSVIPKDFWLVNDYAYYPQQDEFERADRLAMILSLDGNKIASRRPLTNLTEAKHCNYDGTPFGTFVLMHALIRARKPDADIMPVILTVYNDNTYDMDAFHADIKTTVYRKIAEVSQKIMKEDIKQVCFMSLYSYIPATKEYPKTSKERLVMSSKDILVFMSVDQGLNEMEYAFDGDTLCDMGYVAWTMAHGCKDKLDIGKLNMSPIVHAFKSKNHTN